MQAIKNWIIRWLRTNSQMTMTERAFDALKTLENMRGFAMENKVHQSCYHLDPKLLKRYQIQSYVDVWKVLQQVSRITHKQAFEAGQISMLDNGKIGESPMSYEEWLEIRNNQNKI